MLDVRAIKAEREELERQLRADPNVDPRVLMIFNLRELETLYTQRARNAAAHSVTTAPPAEGVRAWPSSAASHSRGTGKLNRPMNPDRLRVLEQAANLIRGRPHPTKTSTIFDALDEEVRGLIRGTDPRANLSAMLHHSPLFASHSRAGWTLVEDEIAQQEVVEAAPSSDNAALKLEDGFIFDDANNPRRPGFLS